MPRLSRPDGAEIHWEQRGEGPTVIIAPHAWALPELFEPLTGELAPEHRVVHYDARGTGESSRRGPHDMETGAADLLALIEETGGPVIVAGMADAANRAARAGVERPDLIPAVVSIGTAPISIEALRETEALVASPTVVDAFIEMLATDYRGAMRPLITAISQQSSEQEVRDRIDRQVAYTPQDVIVDRLRAWNEDDPSESGRALGDRLWMLLSPDTAGPWFPAVGALDSTLRRLLPEARRVEIEDGIISRPDLTADVVRRISAALRVAR